MANLLLDCFVVMRWFLIRCLRLLMHMFVCWWGWVLFWELGFGGFVYLCFVGFVSWICLVVWAFGFNFGVSLDLRFLDVMRCGLSEVSGLV